MRLPFCTNDVTNMRFGLSVKSAGTVRLPETVTVHVPVPAQPPPDQPVKLEALAAAVSGAAVSVIIVPASTVVVHALPQLIASPVTVPAPLPVLATVSV